MSNLSDEALAASERLDFALTSSLHKLGIVSAPPRASGPSQIRLANQEPN